MAPTSRIYLTRHAQAMHNVSEDTTISDAVLTPLGHQQAARLATLTPEIQSVAEVIISSPLRRTLQTTAAGYAPAIERLGGHANIVCLPQLQECSHNPCDTGSAREILESHPEFSKYNLSLLTPEWISKKDFYGAYRFRL
ncbi:hypothetical protein Malapachy_0720 [Malassezia pachydermatis]|uniref:Phosphoglycerate mutase-like protein n=1 Tax=Malassezia pachydermatis TaxID=77020 RepID=A0A0M8MLM2_9BASI|nr:hypothetical protein Malapachy_0720 [Malassezia pachydermatis]KOS14976.1 hypothetical protein Malapachy_0720 [Malassezia pachydermatis]